MTLGGKRMISTIDDLKGSKRSLRKTIKQRIQSIPPDDLRSQSSLVCEKILSMHEYQKATNISAYLSMPTGEIKTDQIIQHALENGKKVFVPFLHGGKGDSKMEMFALTSMEDYQTLEKDSWGIPSLQSDSVTLRENALGGMGIARGDQEIVITSRLDMMVLPGVAFDARNARLGHGKGYYDRYLQVYQNGLAKESSTAEMPYLVGLALKEQLLDVEDTVPTDTTDWTLDAVVSPGD